MIAYRPTDEILDRVQKLSKWLNKNKNQYKCASDTIRAYSQFYRNRDNESLESLENSLVKCEVFLKIKEESAEGDLLK